MNTTVDLSGYNFTVIIPYKHSFNNRFLLKKIIEYYIPFTNCQFIIIEQGAEKTLLESDFIYTDYILAKTENSDTPYNVAWLYNTAIKHVKSDYILFGNITDMVNPNAVLQSLDLFEKQTDIDVISLQNQYYVMRKEQVRYDMEKMLPLLDDKTLSPRYAQKTLFDGLFMMRKKAYQKTAGINEDLLFQHLGAQNNLFTNILKVATLNETIGVKLTESKNVCLLDYISEGILAKSNTAFTKLNELVEKKDAVAIGKYVKALMSKNGYGYKYV